MVTRFGMDERLGYVSYDTGQPSILGQPQGGQSWLERRYSELTAMHIDQAVKAIVDQAFAKSTAILRDNRAVLDRCAKMLLTKETLVESEIRELTKDLKRAGPPPAAAAQ